MNQSNITMMEKEAERELAVHEFNSLLQKARKAYVKSLEASNAVYDALADMRIDGDAEAYRCGCKLKEAIIQYTVHGTGNLKTILNDIRELYGEDW